jgi:hypothetical protein
MSKKSLETLEKQFGLMLTGDDVDTKAQYTDEEFTALLNDPKTTFVGVHHEDRIAFLKDNGHEVTRENMVDVHLPAKPSEE